jgi:hypothetical protein
MTLSLLTFIFPGKVADGSPALPVVSCDSFDVDIKHLVVDVKFGVVKDKIWDSCEILSVWLEWEMVLRNLTLREIFSIFVLHSFSLLSLFSNAPRRLRVGVFCFCVFICNLIFVKKNVKWVGVKLSGKFRIIKLLFCSTLPFILLSFLLF